MTDLARILLSVAATFTLWQLVLLAFRDWREHDRTRPRAQVALIVTLVLIVGDSAYRAGTDEPFDLHLYIGRAVIVLATLWYCIGRRSWEPATATLARLTPEQGARLLAEQGTGAHPRRTLCPHLSRLDRLDGLRCRECDEL